MANVKNDEIRLRHYKAFGVDARARLSKYSSSASAAPIFTSPINRDPTTISLEIFSIFSKGISTFLCGFQLGTIAKKVGLFVGPPSSICSTRIRVLCGRRSEVKPPSNSLLHKDI